MPKNQVHRDREVGAEHFGFSLKPMLDENRGGGLRGDDKKQDKLTDFDRSKAGLQDDHDPSDPGQKQANTTHGVKPR